LLIIAILVAAGITGAGRVWLTGSLQAEPRPVAPREAPVPVVA
jgi:hypothetical protein